MPSHLFREKTALETLESAMVSAGDLPTSLQALVDSVARVASADRAALILMDAKEHRIRHFVRGGEGWTGVMTTISYDELLSGLTGWSLKTGSVALSPSGVPDPRESEEVQFRRVQTHCGSILVVPLGRAGDLLGTLTLIKRLDQPDFTEEEAESMEVRAQFIAGMIRLLDAREDVARARADADAAVRSKMNFLSNLSHELRTPLNGILGFSSLLDASVLDESQKAMVQAILQSGNRLLDTVDNILELAQFEAGQFRLETSPFSPRAVFEGVVARHRASAGDKGLEWKTTMAPQLPAIVEGDAVRLGQAWSHLLSNAVKFTATGTITVHLDSQKTESGRYELVLTVEDTGIGLSSDRSGQWFSPFHQEDGSLTRKFGGTGLGLTLCHRIVRSMGGGLALWGMPGVGTRVRASVELGSEGFPGLRVPSGLRVLLQTLEPEGRLPLVKLLEQAGHRVDIVSDLPAASNQLSSTDYEAVLVEVPAADSVALRELQEASATKGTHLVALLPPQTQPSVEEESPWTAWLVGHPTETSLQDALEKCLFKRVP